jgi:hypothetical protein
MKSVGGREARKREQKKNNEKRKKKVKAIPEGP